MQTFTLGELFTTAELTEIQQAWKRLKNADMTHRTFREEIGRKVLTDRKLEELKQKGYEFDPSYLAYAVEYAMLMQARQ